LLWTGLIIWFVVLFTASAQASVLPPMFFTVQHEFEHAGYFAAGGLCFYLALRAQTPGISALRLAIATVLFCSLIGMFDEWHQTFTPGRSGNDVWDWTADTTGGFIAVLLGRMLK